MSNPLLSLSFELPFDSVQAEDVRPAVEKLITECNARLDQIESLTGKRTFSNTLDAFDRATEPLDIAFGLVSHLENVATTPELREAYNQAIGPVSDFYSSIPLREDLWRALQSYSQTDEGRSLLGEEKRYLEKTLADFKRAGAALPEKDKKRLLEISKKLSKLTTTYKQNVLDSTNEYELLVEEEELISGIPQSALAAAAASAKQKGKKGYRFTLQQPSVQPVLVYADNRELREEMYRALITIATEEPYDNEPLMKEILSLRAAKAELLGYKNFGDLVTEDRMAGSSKNARAFVEKLFDDIEPFLKQEHRDLLEFAKRQAGFSEDELQPWDQLYYAEKLKQQNYSVDEEALRPYFEAATVLNGMFRICSTVFDIQIELDGTLPVWDDSVESYRIRDRDGTHICSFYVDLYPRESKRAGAWMDRIIIGGPVDNGFQPHLGFICCNFTPPVEDRPSLLTHTEVATLFHEFGHLLHQAFSTVRMKGLAGVNVAWDFVELPSQLFENWCWHEESLAQFARHNETGEPLPGELLDRLKKARFFRTATFFARQVGFGMMDFTLHMDFDPETDGSLTEYARDVYRRYSPLPVPEEYARINSFSHLFASPVGYASGYYSYAWAEVLEADVFTRFEAEGILNPETGRALREAILSKGNSEEPVALFNSFMGRNPDNHALLRKAGLLT